MRKGQQVLAFTFLLIHCTSVRAQPPPEPMAHGELASSPSPAPRSAIAIPVDDDALQHSITGQLLLGFPSGARVQIPFLGGYHHYYQAEFFAGGFVAPLPFGIGAVGALGPGARAVFELTGDGAHNALLVGPGLQTLYLTGSSSSFLIAPDVTFGWVHDRQSNGCWEIGRDLGLGATNRGVVPWGAFYAGFHF